MCRAQCLACMKSSVSGKHYFHTVVINTTITIFFLHYKYLINQVSLAPIRLKCQTDHSEYSLQIQSSLKVSFLKYFQV